MPPEDDRERRLGGRAPIELRVEYKRMNTFFADYTKNISRGGTFVATDRPLPVGTEIVFALVLPAQPQPLSLRGRVTWTTPADVATKANPAGMGIEFLYATPGERAEIEALVEGLAVAELGAHLAGRLLGKV